MCSFIFSSKEPTSKSNYLTQKRGPDKTTLTEIGDFHFLHNLLSITGEFTPQPFIDHDNQIVAVYNGEVYMQKNMIVMDVALFQDIWSMDF